MLRSIAIDGFRNFESVELSNLARLTLLAGPNNVGKSSVIHVLLTLLQSEEQRSGADLMLGGAWCDLGSFENVLGSTRADNDRTFSIGLRMDGEGELFDEVVMHFGAPQNLDIPRATLVKWSCRIGNSWGTLDQRAGAEWCWKFGHGDDGAEHQEKCIAIFAHPLCADIRRSSRPHSPIIVSQTYMLHGFSAAKTFYVGPHRIPPRLLYESRASQHGPPLGRYAEHTAEYIYRNRLRETDIQAPPGMLTSESVSMLQRINQWWSYIFEGKLVLRVDAPIRAGFTMSIDTPQAERLDLGQVGFGLSQALPIVVAAIGSRPGDLLLIETPEAHLHPGAQHRLGTLFAILAAAGRQVIVETHSEHIVNALRLAVKNGMPKEQTSILFFRDDDGRAIVDPIPVDEYGRSLKSMPGFFDQAMLELSELLR